MWKSSCLLLALLAGGLDAAPQSTISRPTEYLRSKSRPKEVDREAWKREITATISLLETLAIQLHAASVSETAEIWESAARDFRLHTSDVEGCQKAVALILQSQERQKEGKAEKAADLRQGARDKIKGFHKGAKEEYLQDLRTWISISEGSLRKARAKEAAARK